MSKKLNELVSFDEIADILFGKFEEKLEPKYMPFVELFRTELENACAKRGYDMNDFIEATAVEEQTIESSVKDIDPFEMPDEWKPTDCKLTGNCICGACVDKE